VLAKSVVHQEFITRQDFHAWRIRWRILSQSLWYETPAGLKAEQASSAPVW
jgi:hypothetical protein